MSFCLATRWRLRTASGTSRHCSRPAASISPTGVVTLRGSVPARLFASVDVPAGHRLVKPLDGIVPAGMVRLDLRKIRRERNEVSTIESVMAARQPDGLSSEQLLEVSRAKALAAVDQSYGLRMQSITGPFATLHAEKRRQAEAGGGPLVLDEADRLAILANAAAEDEAVGTIERQRRAVKAALKAATTEDEIKAALASAAADDPKAF